jgi:putative transposase
MKAQTLVSCQLPKHVYRKAAQEHVSIANTLNREFKVHRPNEVWCGVVMSRIFGQAVVGHI